MKWVAGDNLGHHWKLVLRNECLGYVYLCGWDTWNIHINSTNCSEYGFVTLRQASNRLKKLI